MGNGQRMTVLAPSDLMIYGIIFIILKKVRLWRKSSGLVIMGMIVTESSRVSHGTL